MSLLASGLHLTNVSAASAPEGSGHRVPLLPSASHLHRDGVVRIINRSMQAGEVSIAAFDAEGTEYGPLTLRIGANEAAHLTSADLEAGNPDKGLSGGVGEGEGDWRLELTSALDLEVLSYVRTRGGGALASVHEVVPEDEAGHRVVLFNPASNASRVSWLRLVNPGEEAAAVRITGVDDAGAAGQSAVELTLAPRASRMLSAQALESGEDEGLAGALGDGEGKWRLRVTADRPIRVMSLLRTPTGHLTNLSTGRRPDLVVESPDMSDATVRTGASFMLSQTVVNRGEGAAGATTLHSYRSPDSTISASDTLVGTTPVSGLAAGASELAPVVVTAPNSAGTYYYGGCVEPVDGESDTANNCSAGVPVTVESPPPRRPDDVEFTWQECRGRLMESNGETIIAATIRFTLHARKHVGELRFEAYIRNRVSGENLTMFFDADLKTYDGGSVWVGELRAGQSSEHTVQGFVRLDDTAKGQCVVDYEWDPQPAPPPPPPPPRPPYPQRYEVAWNECRFVIDEAKGETTVTLRLTFRVLLNVRGLHFRVFIADGQYRPKTYLDRDAYQWVGDLPAGQTYTYAANGHVKSTSSTLTCRAAVSAKNT